jgi:hypothetical protein
MPPCASRRGIFDRFQVVRYSPEFKHNLVRQPAAPDDLPVPSSAQPIEVLMSVCLIFGGTN